MIDIFFEMTFTRIIVFILSFLVSFFILYKVTPYFIKLFRKNNFVGKDMNKPNKIEVSELGGIPVFFGFIIGLVIIIILSYILKYNYLFNFNFLFIILSTMLLFFFMGFLDDVLGWKKGITQWQHFYIPMILSFPIIIYTIIYNSTIVYLPIADIFINFGLIYSWVFVPIIITATTNSFNLLAGYNGLEAGLGVIIFSTIALFSLLLNNFTLAVILALWIGALCGFLIYNSYSAKIFPGDIITLVNGALAGISAIVLHMEFIIGFLIILYIIEFFIKLKYNFKTECFGIPQKNGIIKPNPKGGSLVHFVLRQGRFTEKSLVSTFYIIQGVISIICVVLFYIFI